VRHLTDADSRQPTYEHSRREDLASGLKHGPCPHNLALQNIMYFCEVNSGMSGAFVPGMSRVSKSNVSSSRIVRRTPEAPKLARGSSPNIPVDAVVTNDNTPHEAFEVACMPHQAEMFGVAMRICRDPDTAKDLVQETLLRAMVAWESFQPGSNLRAWLFRILTNAFINGYRKRRRHQRFATERPGDALNALYGRDQDHTDDLEDALFGDELCDEVKQALGRLGPEYRDVQRADLRGEKYKDIADALHVPIGTVMSRLFRARRVLEGELASFANKDYGIKRAA
jgi:RNA polymerase sigma-70 factor, ECF subfamily